MRSQLQHGAELVNDLINASHFLEQGVNNSTLWELVCGRVTAYLRPAFDEIKALSNDPSESLHHGYYVLRDSKSGRVLLDIVFNDPKPKGESVEGQGLYVCEFDSEFFNEQCLMEVLLPLLVGRMFDDFPTLSYVKINRNIEPLNSLLLSEFFDLEERVVTVRREQVWVIQLAREEK
ncbi:hypothetical protein L1D26_14035 [Vibrio mediterranei]|uniref:hypothetical protein n=1 Tax=Vibrio mediterranei TaxID=689 RepID=UPI001EFE7959|nr:hypothetical protein [Vibrio mediterranei]MCG9664198.1 hypothetical protein [Vibrio mediterranei]